ncbi:MAG: hypothetical protein M3R14_04680 [Acidobacteriota bacterium]|nr:hypothetical protein [Acidobacteriota bacterium]
MAIKTVIILSNRVIRHVIGEIIQSNRVIQYVVEKLTCLATRFSAWFRLTIETEGVLTSFSDLL